MISASRKETRPVTSSPPVSEPNGSPVDDVSDRFARAPQDDGPIDPRLLPGRAPLTVMQRLRNYVSWVYVIASCIFMGPGLDIALLILRPFKKASALGDAIVVWWCKTLAWFWRTEIVIEGLENVPLGQPVVIVANHRSHLDAVSMIVGLRNHLRFGFLIKRSLALIPIWGWFVSLNGYVPLDRTAKKGSQLKSPAQLIKEGRSVVVFAEGTRATDHRFMEFKRGAFVLAARAGVPILPIVVSGTGRLMPKGEVTVRQGKVRIEVLPPVRTRGIPSAARETLLDDVREKIAERYRLTSDGPPAVDDPALMSALLGYNTRRETRSI